MSYHLPNYILGSGINNPYIDYLWDDREIESVLDMSISAPFIAKLTHVGLRAKIALAIGIHEWIAGRFYGFLPNRLAFQIAEAAWCANINVNYIQYKEFDPRQFNGPINGAIYYSANALLPVLYVADNVYDYEDIGHGDPRYYYSPDQWKYTLTSLIALATHIMPEPDIFITWLKQVIERLRVYYSQEDADPFTNLFGQDNSETMLGEQVPREFLDLAITPDKSLIKPLINGYLSDVDQHNPLLVPPEKLKTIIPHPYLRQ